MVWRFSKWPPWQPSWISERNDFSHSETLCCSNVFYQVSAQSDLWYGRRCRLKIFMMATWRPSWISEWNYFNKSKPPCGPNAIHQVWAQSDLRFRSRYGFMIFKIFFFFFFFFAILNLYVSPMLPIRFRLNPTYGLGGDVVWRILRWLP